MKVPALQEKFNHSIQEIFSHFSENLRDRGRRSMSRS